LPAEGAYSAPPDPLAGFKGAASQQEGQGKEGREGTNVGREEGSSPYHRFLDLPLHVGIFLM